MASKRSVNVIAKTSDDRFLMQMRDGSPGICNPLKWNFFGGQLHHNEEPLAGAMREFSEETHLLLSEDDFSLKGEFYIKENTIYVVEVTRLVNFNDIRLGEGAGFGHFKKDEIFKIDVTDMTKNKILDFV